MTRASPQMRDFARRLIACEATETKSSAGKLPEAFSVSEKLRPQLTTLMGSAGFRALLARAHTLAAAEVPALRSVEVNSGGALEGLDKLRAQLGADDFLECRVVLLARLLGLLEAFIGENLTVRLVREVWPKLPPSTS